MVQMSLDEFMRRQRGEQLDDVHSKNDRPEPVELSPAESAFHRAKDKIVKERAEGLGYLSFDDDDFRALDRLPEEIGDCDALRELNLDNTRVSDVTALSGLTELTALYLNGTGVTDLAPLSRLTELTQLWLRGTGVTDLAPLAGMTGLMGLWLMGKGVTDFTPLSGLTGLKVLDLYLTGVTDLAPLSGLTALTGLRLNGTDITDLAPLSRLTELKDLDLDKTPVIDLRPIRGLHRLAEEPGSEGLTFTDCAACEADPEIARISEIEDNKKRAAALFDYLEDWVPPGEAEAPDTRDADMPQPPKPGIAPLQAEVIDGHLVRVGAHGLPESDAMARAEAGWRALREYRRVFGQSCNVHNYSQLVAVLDGFDAAMGEDFDADRLILIGTMGSAVVALADDAAFRDMLPVGTPPLLSQFAVHIETYVNRFPDWVAYKEETADKKVAVARVAEDRPAFEEIETGLRDSAETDREVAEDYAVQVAHGAHEESDPAVVRGLVASTRETMRALSEAGIEGIRSGKIARDEIGELDKVHDTELAKVKWYAGGFAIVFLRRRSAPLRRLARRYPSQLGWLVRVLDYLGAE